jgi:hypothetical protein
MSNNNEQPFVDAWPMWDEPLSKIPADVDIDRARERLARKFNVHRNRRVDGIPRTSQRRRKNEDA